ncbi:MAG: PorT family protein [Flavobacterium sp.]|nr:PorT family protein [Flavobacterium sp.]
MQKLVVFFVFLVGCFSVASAQYGYRDGNRIGLSAGITQLGLSTTNFTTKPSSGWMGGLSVRGNYYNNFSMIFGMQFTESHFTIASKTPITLQNTETQFKVMGAQIRLLLSYNIVKDHVSLDFGPVLQVNDKLKIKATDENNTLNETPLIAKDILDVNKVNGNLYLGISAGNKRVRAVAFYQYGVNNFLNHLNQNEVLLSKNLGRKFDGHLGLLSAQLLVNL